jgi:hypothetical protein
MVLWPDVVADSVREAQSFFLTWFPRRRTPQVAPESYFFGLKAQKCRILLKSLSRSHEGQGPGSYLAFSECRAGKSERKPMDVYSDRRTRVRGNV